MSTDNTQCPGSGQTPIPTHNIHDGSWWPHGREECPHCHGFYSTKRDGALYRHKPHAGDDDRMTAMRSKLESERRQGITATNPDLLRKVDY